MAGLDMSNLGIALGAGVDEWHRQKDELRQDQRAARDDEQFAWQRDQYARQKAAYDRSQQLQSQRDALLKEYADHDAYVAGLDNVPDEQLGEYIKQGITKYNTSPLFKNGYFANATVLNGQPVIVHGDMARKSSEIIPITRDGVKAGATHMSDMLRKQLAMLSPEDFQTYTAQERQVGLERDKIGIQRTTADAAMRNAATQEQFRQDSIDERRRAREEDVNYMQDGTGRILGFRQGKLIGAFGSARPVMGGGDGSGAASWAPLGTDADGTPVMMDRKTMQLRRLDGAPIQDVKSLYRKMTGEGQRVDPEMNKQILAAKIGLGPRPAAKKGWFSDNDTAGTNWDAQQQYLDGLMGRAGGAPVDEQRNELFGSSPSAAAETKPSTSETLRQAAQQRDAGFAASRRHVADAQDRAGAAEVARLRAALGTNGLRTSLRDQEAEDLRRLLAANQR